MSLVVFSARVRFGSGADLDGGRSQCRLSSRKQKPSDKNLQFRQRPTADIECGERTNHLRIWRQFGQVASHAASVTIRLCPKFLNEEITEHRESLQRAQLGGVQKIQLSLVDTEAG